MVGSFVVVGMGGQAAPAAPVAAAPAAAPATGSSVTRDGQSLAGQPAATQAMFRAVRGDRRTRVDSGAQRRLTAVGPPDSMSERRDKTRLSECEFGSGAHGGSDHPAVVGLPGLAIRATGFFGTRDYRYTSGVRVARQSGRARQRSVRLLDVVAS